MTTVKSRTDAMDSDNNSVGTQVSSQIQMYLKHNHDDCLASAVEVFATALGFVINNPNLVTSKKSAEILRDDGSESYLLLKSVETQINTNLRRVTDLSQLKTKQLETRLQGMFISCSIYRLQLLNIFLEENSL
ncbi:PREDICTED: uncharacterized protein LOC105955133 [Erythranthe guttata]|uniref:uncharacterized protein LOC105955133 n=1 Tax=Erythranthe guttata TaxID=4155 RepID=UPI00064E0B49|nr:PREDICTED: uncharacterized protein LOC105955133 [Erythranthe guttata]|eukprot:XP_012834295.1 PREDICTED: uncharacterized protein LOC105955133 [Erythranthe guttata]